MAVRSWSEAIRVATSSLRRRWLACLACSKFLWGTRQGQSRHAWGPKAIGDGNFLGVTLDVSEECRKWFLDTNKKTNYIARQETAKQIY
jgi:hypothetical protein